MPNLFNAIEKIPDDEIRTQIALMRCVTISNAAAETGHRAIGRLARWANMMVNPGNDESSLKFDYRVVTLSDRVKEQIASMHTMGRAELMSLLREELYSKCRELDASIIPEAMDNDTLSVWIIREAGRIFSIADNITPANIAVEVAGQYNDRLLVRLHKMLAAQNADEAKDTDRKLQAALNRVPIEVMRDMASRIRPPEFSGAGIGKVLRREQGTAALSVVTEAMGLEVFDVITLRAMTIFDMLASLNRMPRAFLAELTWLCLNYFGRKFTFAADLFPSFRQGTSAEAMDEEERSYWQQLSDRRNGRKRIQDVKKDISRIEEKLSKVQVQYLSAVEDKNKADNEFRRLESERAVYDTASILKTSDEKKRYYAEVTKAGRNRDWANEALARMESQLDGIGNQLMDKKNLLENMEEDFAGLRSRTDLTIARKSRELALQWKAYFFRFTFDDVIFSSVVTDFTRSEMLKLEEYLKEMHDSRNPNGYSLWTEEEISDDGTVKVTYCAVRCLVGQGKNAKILYDNTYIRKIETGQD